MTITTITDCKDSNAFGRQSTRIHSLFNITPVEVAIDNDIEAAGNLIDALDALQDEEGIIIVNVAPRQGVSKKWKNGTPFCYFYFQNKLIISSIQGYVLSLVKKFGLTSDVNLLDTETVATELRDYNLISKEHAEYIERTQFRSFDYLPFVAKCISTEKILSSTKLNINEISNISDSIWWVDNFGNCKTTLTIKDLNSDQIINTKYGEFKFYSSLKDVPNNQIGVIEGSSGLSNNKFLELVIQGKSFSKKYNVKPGDNLKEEITLEITSVGI